MSSGFDYECAWHVLAGWLDASADLMPPEAAADLAAAYILAVQMGHRYGQAFGQRAA